MEKDFEKLQKAYLDKKNKAAASQDVEAIKVKGRKYLFALKKKLYISIGLYLLTVLAIIFIDKVSSSSVITSRLGFWLLIVCCLYYASSKVYLLHRLNKIKLIQPVSDTTRQMIAYKNMYMFLSTYGEIMYAIVLSIGVYLYLVPVPEFGLTTMSENSILLIKWSFVAYVVWVIVSMFINRKKLKMELGRLEEYLELLQEPKLK